MAYESKTSIDEIHHRIPTIFFKKGTTIFGILIRISAGIEKQKMIRKYKKCVV